MTVAWDARGASRVARMLVTFAVTCASVGAQPAPASGESVVRVTSLTGAPIPLRPLLLAFEVDAGRSGGSGATIVIRGERTPDLVASVPAGSGRVLVPIARDPAGRLGWAELRSGAGETLERLPLTFLGTMPRGTIRTAVLGELAPGGALAALQGANPERVQLVAGDSLPEALPLLDCLVLGERATELGRSGMLAALETAVAGGVNLLLATPAAEAELRRRLPTGSSALARALTDPGAVVALGGGRVLRAARAPATAPEVLRQMGSLRARRLLPSSARMRAFEGFADSGAAATRLTLARGAAASGLICLWAVAGLCAWLGWRRSGVRVAVAICALAGLGVGSLWIPLAGGALIEDRPLAASGVTAVMLAADGERALIEEIVAVAGRRELVSVNYAGGAALPLDPSDWAGGTAWPGEGRGALELRRHRVGLLVARDVLEGPAPPVIVRTSRDEVHVGNRLPDHRTAPALVYAGGGRETRILGGLAPGELLAPVADARAVRSLEEEWGRLLRLPPPDLAANELLVVVEDPRGRGGLPRSAPVLEGAAPDRRRLFWLVRAREP